MKYSVVEQTKQEHLCDIEIDIKPTISECIIHDGLPYQIGNIVYFEGGGNWFPILVVRRVNEMKVGKTGDIYEGDSLDAMFKKLLGI